MSGRSAAARKYHEVQVRTSSPGDVLLLLYQGLFRFGAEAKAALLAGDLAVAGQKISKAHAILEELCAGLNYDIAPELAEKLEAVYGFAMTRLVEANVKRSPELIEEALRPLRPLYEAWKAATEQTR